MILNKSQAESIFAAISALNKIKGATDVSFDVGFDGGVGVAEYLGKIYIIKPYHEEERYEDQKAFCEAYNIKE